MKEHDPKKRELNPKAQLPQLKEALPTPTLRGKPGVVRANRLKKPFLFKNVPFKGKKGLCLQLMSRLSEELQSPPSQTYPSGPDPLRRPDSDPILT